MSVHILYALAIVAVAAMTCTTAVGLWSKDNAQATIILAAIAAIASPLIMGLLNMYKSWVDSESAKVRSGKIVEKLDSQTREIKTEVQDAFSNVKTEVQAAATNVTKNVANDVAVKAAEVANQLARDHK